MKISKMFVLSAVALISFSYAAQPQAPVPAPAPQMPVQADCSALPMEMQTFAGQLAPANKATFCGKFNDGQRSQAMEMSMQKDSTGKSMMTPDQSVEQTAKDSNMMMNPGKSPGGCPVK